MLSLSLVLQVSLFPRKLFQLTEWPRYIPAWVTNGFHSEADRKLITGQLLQGVWFEKVHDTIKNSVENTIHRLHLTSKKDIGNIEKVYNIVHLERHEGDTTSVHFWVEELKQKGDRSPALFLKPQHEIHQNSISTSKNMILFSYCTPHYRQKCCTLYWSTKNCGP